jgi:hypothetical protein
MFYQLKKRSDELVRISKLSDLNSREDELRKFIAAEKMLLLAMVPPRTRSKVMDTATILLRTVEFEKMNGHMPHLSLHHAS